MRRPIGHTGMSSGWRFTFKNTGRLDYHVAERKVDGQLYSYIWRDEVEA